MPRSPIIAIVQIVTKSHVLAISTRTLWKFWESQINKLISRNPRIPQLDKWISVNLGGVTFPEPRVEIQHQASWCPPSHFDHNCKKHPLTVFKKSQFKNSCFHFETHRRHHHPMSLPVSLTDTDFVCVTSISHWILLLELILKCLTFRIRQTLF